ncbi:MAG: TrkA family potassium uptake protein [Acidobacteria bacterium]|nr:TrkA family potassium uptake protein [Acidobacteriota bacterium]
MSRFAVIGLGRFGSTLVRKLYQEGHEVIGIDVDPELVQSIRDDATQAVALDVRDKDRLRALGLKDVDVAIVSVGENLEASTLAAFYLNEMGVKVVARAVSIDHGHILEAIGVDEVIYPERDMALRLADRLTHPNLLDYVALGPEYSVMEVAVPSSFIGQTLQTLRIRNRYRVQVVAIRDALTDSLNLMPTGDDVLKDSDVLVVLGAREDLDKFREVA